MSEKKISLTAFLKLARQRVNIARLFMSENGKPPATVVLTENRMPRYRLEIYRENIETAKLITRENDIPIVRSEEKVAYNAQKELKTQSYAGVETTWRFFLAPGADRRIKENLGKRLRETPVVIIHVPDYEVEDDPERYAGLKEVSIGRNS